MHKSSHWSRDSLAATEYGEMKSILISIKVVASEILFLSKTALLNQLGPGSSTQEARGAGSHASIEP